MSLEKTLELARHGRLYPSVILHGGTVESRQQAAITLGRALLCLAAAPQRPCGQCRHCRRIVWPQPAGLFHPDFQVLERDLKTVTSAEATRNLLRIAQVTPFEARGQVLVVASAETLSGEAADALLKGLEEPAAGAPRHFLLLAASRLDLPATLRSRSLATFLGPAEPLDAALVDKLAGGLAAWIDLWASGGGVIGQVAAAGLLAQIEGFEDPRAGRPWGLAAAAVAQAAERPGLAASVRRGLLGLAEELLAAPQLRLRGIPAERILEGLVSRHLGSTPVPAARR